MLDESEFLQGVVPDVTWCMGMQLRPVCIGHRLLLKRVKSPLYGFEGSISYSVLREAVLVFSHSFERASALLNSTWTGLLLCLWHLRLTWLGFRRVNIRRIYRVLKAHIDKSTAFNPIVIPRCSAEGPSEMSCTVEWVLVTMLMQKFHMTLSEALNCPWSVAHWLHGAGAEMTGAAAMATWQGIEEAKSEADRAHEKIAAAIAAGKIKRGR